MDGKKKKHTRYNFFFLTDKPTETKLTYESKNKFVVVEDTVVFACSADSFPPSKLELRFNNKILGYFYNGRFSLHRVNTSNEGVYECIARNMLGTGVSPRVSLTVYGMNQVLL